MSKNKLRAAVVDRLWTNICRLYNNDKLFKKAYIFIREITPFPHYTTSEREHYYLKLVEEFTLQKENYYIAGPIGSVFKEYWALADKHPEFRTAANSLLCMSMCETLETRVELLKELVEEFKNGIKVTGDV